MKQVKQWLFLLLCWTSQVLTADSQSLPAQPAVRTYYEQIFSGIKRDTAYIKNQIRTAIALQEKNVDTSITLLYDAIKKSYAINYTDGVVMGMLRLGNAYMNRDMFEQSLVVYQQALATAGKGLTDKGMIPMLYSGMAATYFQLGKFESAAYVIYKSIEELHKNNIRNYSSLVYIYSNAGSFWMKMGNKETALQYLRNAEMLARRKKDSVMLCAIYSNTGGVYLKKSPDTARYYFQMAARIAKNHSIPTQIAALTNLGFLAINAHQPEQAMHYLEQAQRLSKTIKKGLFLDLNYALGVANFEVKNYRKAEELLTYVAQKSAEIGKSDRAEHIPYARSLLYAETGRYREAYEQLKQVFAMSDSLIGTEKKRIINQLEVKYRTAEKDKELAQNQLQITRQQNNIQKKNLWIGGISSGVVLLAAFVVALFRSNRHKRKAQDRQIHILRQEQEIAQLKAMMQGEEKERNRIARELHDGIGGLLSASKMNFNLLPEAEMPHLTNFSNGIHLLDEAYDQLRKTAHNLQPETLLQEGLSRAAQHYCDLIGKGLPIRIMYTAFGDIPRMNPEAELSLYRIIQELINNTVKHARATEIVVQLSVHESQLHIAVEDNGTGIPPDRMEQNEGMGLKNLKSRIVLLGGTMEIDSRIGSGTAFYLEFDTDQLKKTTSP